MKTEDFNYFLPGELIAQTPARPRDSSRLLVLNRQTGDLTHSHFRDLPQLLRSGDLLVLNRTRVLPARLFARKIPGGGRVELLLLRKESDRTWEVLVGGKGVREGRRLLLEMPDRKSVEESAASDSVPLSHLDTAADRSDEQGSGRPSPSSADFRGGSGSSPVEITAEVAQVLDGPRRLVRFSQEIEPVLEQIGHIPLPPYIHRPVDDPDEYQTIFASSPGSAAAPTAGLHFTPGLVERLKSVGVGFAFVTLHIGLDTFAPVTEDRAEAHRIHSEWCWLDRETAAAVNQTRSAGGRVVAVGTTSVRTLESAARGALDGTIVSPFEGATDLYILPGFQFKAVDVLVTNFHLPRSTLLMLVSAFAGRERILASYETAVREGYRFYSLGDAMLIL